MPARIVLVHDDPDFREGVVMALEVAGYDVKAFAGSMEAIAALEVTQRIELLITRAAFPKGTPNGVSLARMARMKKPGIRVLFAARDENREHTEGLGEFLAVPVTGPEIVATVKRMLAKVAA
jgi:DNA-binding response OmpR family regulator